MEPTEDEYDDPTLAPTSMTTMSCAMDNAKHMHTLLASLLLGRKKDQLVRCDIDASGLWQALRLSCLMP